MQDIITALPMLIPCSILFILVAVLSFALYIYHVKPSAEDVALDRWQCRLRRTGSSIAARYRGAFIFGACLGAFFGIICWVLCFLIFPAFPNLQIIDAVIQIVPMYLADMLTGNTHEDGIGRSIVFLLLVFLQWFSVGFTLFVLTTVKHIK